MDLKWYVWVPGIAFIAWTASLSQEILMFWWFFAVVAALVNLIFGDN
jgi:hypothetical protein